MKVTLTAVVGFAAFVAGASLQAKTIEGQVFIATAGGQAIKLPLVEVAAIPRAELEEQVANVRAKLDDDRTKCYAELADVERKHERAWAAFESANNQAQSRDRRRYPDAQRRSEEALAVSRQLYSRREVLLARRAVIDSAVPYFERLPRPVATAKTDADGRFNVDLPEEGEYVLVARATRNVFGTVEKYYWMVRLTLEQSKVMLSNDNLSRSGSPESLIATKQ